MNEKPPKSNIIEKSIGNGKEWEIPAKKGVGCLMLFGFAFCVIPLMALVIFVYQAITGTGEPTPIWAILGVGLFLSIFLMIGGGISYFGYKSSRTSYRVRVVDGAVEVVKQCCNKETIEKLDRKSVQGVGLYTNSRVNNKPVYGLVAKARGGEDLRFLSGHANDELRWLASEILTTLSEQGGLPTEEEMEEMYFGDNDDTGVASNGANFEKQGVKISLLGGDEFEIEKRGTAIAKPMVIGGLFGMIFGGVFFWIGFLADNGPIIFGIVGAIIDMVSFILFFSGIKKLGTTEKFTFKSDTIIKEKLRGSVSNQKTVYQKSDYRELEVKSSGSSNNEARFSVKLKGGAKDLVIFQWVNQDVSQAVKHKVNAWLKPENASPTSLNRSEDVVSSGYGSAITVETTVVDYPERKVISPKEVLIYSSSPNLKDVKGGKWFVRAFLGIFLAVGLGLVITGISNIKSARESMTWPATKGVILKSEVKTSRSDDSTTYGADISYEYQVNKQTYTGNKVTFGDVSTSKRSRAEKIVDRFPVEKTVDVFYNPEDPKSSVLEPGLNGGIWLLPGVGSVFLIIPLIILIAAERGYRKSGKDGKAGNPTKHSAEEMQKRYGKVE